MKPILFNSDMVRALLEGNKTVTRRVVKPQPEFSILADCKGRMPLSYWVDNERWVKPPYQPGDILYVRETWAKMECSECNEDGDACESVVERDGLTIFCNGDMYVYKATDLLPGGYKWHPSIHMPREAARIFLRVTDVRVERLQTIMDDPPGPENQIVKEGCKYGCDFIATWESTIKPADRALYGWVANPWVWVIEFERCEKLEEKVEPC